MAKTCTLQGLAQRCCELAYGWNRNSTSGRLVAAAEEIGLTMAWSGKPNSKQKTAASIKSRTSRKPLPPASNPYGIPPEVMRALSNEKNLSNDRAAFNRRLQELLAAHKLTDGR